MFNEIIKGDLLTSLFDIVEDKDTQKKIYNVLEKVSDPYVIKLKHSIKILFLITMFIVILLVLNLYLTFCCYNK